jgi:hypothetical protein
MATVGVVREPGVQTAAVTGVLLWTLRQTRLPVGGITLMLTISGPWPPQLSLASISM